MKLPDRWLEYEKSGKIFNTRFVACKTPLRKGFSGKLDFNTSFTPKMLLETHPCVGLVIDLTMTLKYYNGYLSPISKQHSKSYVTGLGTDSQQEFERRGVKYVKIRVNGHGQIPSEAHFKMFVETVRAFIETHPVDSLIAVHCTHGINRTGYLIVRYMIENMGCDLEEALLRFRICRGHPIERVALIQDLQRKYRNLRGWSNV